jgi:hypothetical protein
MLSTILKKRLSASQFANIFINVIYETTENGFEVIAEMINSDPAFIVSPEIKIENSEPFQFIVLAANFKNLEKHFDTQEAEEIKSNILSKLSTIYKTDTKKILDVIHHYIQLINRVNHPSKNMLYGMSKALFYKYDLNNFQDEYFKRMQAPNPLFLKRMDNILVNFLWDWDSFTKKYRI